MIGVAQGILLARYELPGPDAAFTLLREGSQRHNLPLRVLASAVVTAPPPQSGTRWFTARSAHLPPPTPGSCADTASTHTTGARSSPPRCTRR